MTLFLVDLGKQIKLLSYNSYFKTFDNPIFSIEHIYNTGSAFGMFQNSILPLSIVTFLIIVFLFIYVLKFVNFSNKPLLLSLTLINSGAIGNFLERIRLQHVIDYINLKFASFPIFNAYDAMICSGIMIYIIFVLVDINKIKIWLKAK